MIETALNLFFLIIIVVIVKKNLFFPIIIVVNWLDFVQFPLFSTTTPQYLHADLTTFTPQVL